MENTVQLIVIDDVKNITDPDTMKYAVSESVGVPKSLFFDRKLDYIGFEIEESPFAKFELLQQQQPIIQSCCSGSCDLINCSSEYVITKKIFFKIKGNNFNKNHYEYVSLKPTSNIQTILTKVCRYSQYPESILNECGELKYIKYDGDKKLEILNPVKEQNIKSAAWKELRHNRESLLNRAWNECKLLESWSESK